MSHRREQALLALAFCTLAAGVTAGQSLPADRAENAVASTARGGLVTPGAGGVVTLAMVEAAVRTDAGQAWQLGDLTRLSISSEEVTWSDGSLGCPRPGMSYTQALVPGWRLLVRHGQREAVYHASRRGQWLSCPGSSSTPPRVGESVR
jgi:hypothetical protein